MSALFRMCHGDHVRIKIIIIIIIISQTKYEHVARFKHLSENAGQCLPSYEYKSYETCSTFW